MIVAARCCKAMRPTESGLQAHPPNFALSCVYRIAMRTHASIIAVTGLLFLVTLITGLVQSRNLRLNDPRPSGKPIASGISTVHKLFALAALITAAVAIRRLHRGMEFTSLELTAVIIAGLFFLLMIISGGLLSLGRPRSDELLAIHKVCSVLTVIPTFGAIYLLTRGRL